MTRPRPKRPLRPPTGTPGPNRREVLAVLGALAATSACGGGGGGESSGEGGAGGEAATVVVIGAGMSGLAAARDLVAAGLRVTVLEGRDRIGGRTHTDRRWPGVPADVGASWIHGLEGNPLTALAEAHDLVLAPTDYERHDQFLPGGAPVDEAALEDLSERFGAAVEAERERRIEADEDDTDLRSFAEAWAEEEGLTEEEVRWLDYLLASEVEHEFASDARDLSLIHFDDAGEERSDDAVMASGWSALVEILAEGLEIRTGAVVTQVAHDEAAVRITLADGAEVRADYAIVTVPLGVLKRGDLRFSPALPAAHRGAIERLGVGVLDKLFLHFESASWREVTDAHLIGNIGDGDRVFAEFLNLDAVAGVPVLLGFNAGDPAAALAEMDDEAVVERAMEALRGLFGEDLPDPDGFVRTRWGQDPFAWGSYSHLPPGATVDDHEALAEPAGERLFLAGEHTSAEAPSTVHGALRSGQRAARQVLAAVGD